MQQTQISTSLSVLTFVVLRYDPCGIILMFRDRSGSYSRIASETMRSALACFSHSVSLDGLVHFRRVSSQSLATEHPTRLAGRRKAQPPSQKTRVPVTIVAEELAFFASEP